jgi:hypothetical protein
MKIFEKLRNQPDVSEGRLIFFTISVLFLAGCLVVQIPAIRDLIITFGDFLAGHPILRPKWHEKMIIWSLCGIGFYIIFFFSFFYTIFFNVKTPEKKLVWLVIVVSTGIVFLIMFRANWTFGDDHQFITTTAVNKYIPLYIFPGIGRFFPLGLFHYNIPLFVFRLLGVHSGLPAIVHFMLTALFYAASALCLYSLFNSLEPFKDKNYPNLTAFFVCIFPLLLSSFPDVLMSLIFSETQIILLFSVFMYMYHRALATDKKRYYTVAMLVAVYSSYCKEPVFGAFLVVALSNHLFRYKSESKKEKLFYASLIVNGILFLFLYYFLSFKNTTGFYNEERVEMSTLHLAIFVFMRNPFLFFIYALGFVRLFYVIVKKENLRLYYDCLLFAGMGYIFAYIVLKLNYGYYFVPSIILSLPSLVYWTKYLFQKKKLYALLSAGFFMIICIPNAMNAVHTVKNIIQNRKEFIPYIENLFSEYNDGKSFVWYESDNTVTDNTFYKAVRNWRKAVENLFLNYTNKSDGKDFFFVLSDMDKINFNENILFFYPTDNDQGQPISGNLIKILNDNNFQLYKDDYGILIFQKAEF